MSAPRLDVDLVKIQHNTRTLVDRLAVRGISVTGVTKATLGSPEIARAFLRGGVKGLGDSRIENVEALHLAGVRSVFSLVRSPMMSQARQVVAHAEVSFNTEVEVLRRLSSIARLAGKTHGVVLMVELGDLREGILPANLEGVVRETLCLPGIALVGIGANFACRSGVAPGAGSMAELSALANSIESTFGIVLGVVSGGNSANLPWALGSASTGRISNLRLGESLLLGREPLGRGPIEGLHTDAITLSAEVIEAKRKPSLPLGRVVGQSADEERLLAFDRGAIRQTILALGRQDTDPDGLCPPPGAEVLGASSDHLIADLGPLKVPVGGEVTFQLDYGALVRAMTSPFVTKVMKEPIGTVANPLA